MNISQPGRAAAFARTRPAASIAACGGSVSHVVLLPSGRFSNAEYPLRNGLWHPLNVSLPPRPCRAAASQSSARSSRPNCRGAVWSRGTRPPPSGGLQHGLGPAGCAALLKARFDRRLNWCPSGDLGGQEGRVADRAFTMLEPAARRGAGGSGTFKGCQSLVEGIPGLRLTPSACRDSKMQNDLFRTNPPTHFARRPTRGLNSLGAALPGSA